MNKIILLAIFVNGIFFSVAAKEAVLAAGIDNVKSARDCYMKGKDYLSEGDYEKANEYFRKAEEMLSSVEDQNVKKENSIIQKEADINGIERVEEHIKNKDKDAQEDVKKEIVPQQEVKSKKDTLVSKKTVEIDNNILKEAQEKYQRDNLDEVLNLYKQVIEKYPKNYNLHYNLGVIYLKKADYSNATEEFETVIKLNRRDKDAYYNLGIIYESFLDEKDKAIECYKKYSELVSEAGEKKRIKSWIDYIKIGRIK